MATATERRRANRQSSSDRFILEDRLRIDGNMLISRALDQFSSQRDA
jgi:hypothetical protein